MADVGQPPDCPRENLRAGRAVVPCADDLGRAERAWVEGDPGADGEPGDIGRQRGGDEERRARRDGLGRVIIGAPRACADGGR